MNVTTIRILCCCSLVYCLLIAPLTSFAEVYRFVDEQGSTHFVDTLDKVPMRYRVQLLTPEEQAALREDDHTSILLFPYETIEDKTLKKGLWELSHNEPITYARAISFPAKKAKIEKGTRYEVVYNEQEKLIVYKVRVNSKEFTDLHGRHIPYQQLSGFILKDQLP